MAALPVELHPEALTEAREARLWYGQRNTTAALRFLNELDRAIEQIALYPDRWPEHLHGTRRYLLRRFPYLLVYRYTAERIEIIACQHGRRRPGYWRDRVGGLMDEGVPDEVDVRPEIQRRLHPAPPQARQGPDGTGQ